MQAEQKTLEQKNHELVDGFKDKSRSQQQLQKLYQSLKAQVMASAVQTAASDDAEQTLQMLTGSRLAERLGSRGSLEHGLSSLPSNTPAVGMVHHRRSSGPRGANADNGRNFNGPVRGYTSRTI